MWQVTPYFWLAELNGDVTVRGFEAEVDQELGDAWDLLVDNFDIAGAVRVEVYSGDRWGFLGDAMYMRLESEGNGPVTGQEIDGEFEQFVGELGAFYRVVGAESDARRTLDLLGGVRLNYLSLELDPTIGFTRDDSQTWIDPFIGVRGSVPAGDRAALFARGDVGGFGIDEGTTSDFVWNVEAGLRYDLSNHTALSVGYRWLGTDFENDDDGFAYDLVASGPFFSLTLRW